MQRAILWGGLWLAGASIAAGGAAGAAGALVVPAEPAPVVQRLVTQEATQGVASDGAYIYAVGNSEIGKYRLDNGERVAHWQGDSHRFPHLNSCTIVEAELVCAASNYPAVPQLSRVEVFDRHSMEHKRTVDLGAQPGSLTVMDRHDGKWWGVLANYDGKGGAPERDHRQTLLVRFNDTFQPEARWSFPPAVLARFAPRSCSGASWGADGRLYVSGHDRPEIYVLSVPQGGGELLLQAIVPVTTGGQAIDWDPQVPDLLWSIARADRAAVSHRITAPVPDK